MAKVPSSRYISKGLLSGLFLSDGWLEIDRGSVNARLGFGQSYKHLANFKLVSEENLMPIFRRKRVFFIFFFLKIKKTSRVELCSALRGLRAASLVPEENLMPIFR